MTNRPDEHLLRLIAIAREAGAAILDVYEAGDIAVSRKADDSPVTEADRRAHELIASRLGAAAPQVPVLSEEGTEIPWATRRGWRDYYLVDPLDGTREFIARNGEFTVNIAHIRAGEPVSGVVHVPVSGVSYAGTAGLGAFKVAAGTEGAGGIQPIETARRASGEPLRVVASRRHRDARTNALIEGLRRSFGAVEVLTVGSSLKMCLLAEGAADFYPRLAPTSEWDTAAAHAVLRAAGGEVMDTAFAPLRYNSKESLLNPHFYSIADPSRDWRELLGGAS